MPQQFVCDFKGCDFRGNTDTGLKGHVSSVHPNVLPDNCRLDIVNGKKWFYCLADNCRNSKGFHKCSRFVEHYKMVHQLIKPFACDFKDCNHKCATKAILKKHIENRHSVTELKCDFEGCGKWFKSDRYLKAHQQRVHLDCKKFLCPHEGCGQRFYTNGQLLIHSSKHTNQPTIKCPLDGCNQMYFTEHQLRKHQELVHNRKMFAKRVYIYTCDWPGCEWTGKSLTDHKRMHTGDKPYVCEWPDCGKRFRLLSTFKGHTNVHTNTKPYACHWPGCQYRCSNSANVYKHFRRLHNKK